jgi:hypothetical protein
VGVPDLWLVAPLDVLCPVRDGEHEEQREGGEQHIAEAQT